MICSIAYLMRLVRLKIYRANNREIFLSS